MSRARQWWIVAAIVVLAAAGVTVGVNALSDEFATVTAGTRAPGFRGVTVDSVPQPRTLADYRNQVVVLNVWATWCAPCRVEMPSFQRLYEEFRDDGLRVVAVSVDAPGMEQPIRDFVAELGLTFDIVYDSPGAIQRDYMTTGVPETFIIGRDGVIRLKELGFRLWDSPEMKTLISGLLAEPD